MQKVVALWVLFSPWLAGCWSCGGYRVEPHSPGPDAGRPLPARDAAAGRDVMTADVPRWPPDPRCAAAGRMGGPCRFPGHTCETGAMCQAELASLGAPLTIRSGYDIEQGEPDPDDPAYFREVTTADPEHDVPLIAAPGDFCTQVCDARLGTDPTTGADPDCTSCSTCSTAIGTIGLLTTWTLYPVAMRTFGTDTGWCRADCELDLDSNGGCPTGYTCSPRGNVCVEACQSDTECQFSFEERRDGSLVTVIDADRGTCNRTTGRCEWTPTGTPHVGDACESSSDCAADIGVCLEGGTCATYTCPDVEAGPSFNCDRDGDVRTGICLGNGDNFGAICIAGCNSADDCNPGNACLPLGTTAGRFTGYCLGVCDTHLDDPDGSGPLTAADDEIWSCRRDERCDMDPVTADEPDPTGTCRPPCTMATEATVCDTTRGERCDMLPAPATHGFCRVPDRICALAPTVGPEVAGGCFFGQLCDPLARSGPLGLCVDRCRESADCDLGEVCDASRGLCRTPCSASGPACASEQVCTAGLCEEPPA